MTESLEARVHAPTTEGKVSMASERDRGENKETTRQRMPISKGYEQERMRRRGLIAAVLVANGNVAHAPAHQANVFRPG